jgi:hypothetical protein
MKFLRKTAGYTLMDHKQNEEIIQELQVASIINKIQITKPNGYSMSQEWMTKGILKKCCNTNLEGREDLEDFETTFRRYSTRGRNRPVRSKFVKSYDDDDDDDDNDDNWCG